MKAFGKYISKYLLSFVGFTLILLLINFIVFILTFYGIVSGEYGSSSPPDMLESIANDLANSGISEHTEQKMADNQIWAMLLNEDGLCVWEYSLPENLSTRYKIQEVAAFSKGYLCDYPVFTRSTETGLLVLGYPKGSYAKIPGNYYPTKVVKVFPVFALCIVAFDFVLLFLVYYISKRNIVRYTEPIIDSIRSLSEGNPVKLYVQGELSEIANSVNQASNMLSKQNQARANWIIGVSHDIRTPLSMIMGYANRITEDCTVSKTVQQEAAIIQLQSIINLATKYFPKYMAI